MGNMEGEGDESYESGIPIKDIDKIFAMSMKWNKSYETQVFNPPLTFLTQVKKLRIKERK
jgi:hypothetical protein